jgi:serine/threonine protein kinase
MSFCINPHCEASQNQDSDMFCQSCQTELLLEGQYRVERLISDDTGQANIYRVKDGEEYKVLKVLREETPKFLELFRREAAILESLSHPGIPQFEGYFSIAVPDSSLTLHCLVMEEIPGLNLELWMKSKQNKPILEKLAIRWLDQLSQIIHAVHQKQLFHGDIKPSNIMLQPNGELALIDFGIAKKLGATHSEKYKNNAVTKMHSSGYAPNEQSAGRGSHQSDFFALGRTFVHLLTGQNPDDLASPYKSANTDEDWNWRLHTKELSSNLADFIDYLMHSTPAKRPKDSQELVDKVGKLAVKLNLKKTTPSSKITKSSIDEDINSSQIIAQKKVLGDFATWHLSDITAIAITNDSSAVISAGLDGYIKVWDISSGELLQNIPSTSGAITCLGLSPNGKTLVSGANSGRLTIWDMEKDGNKWILTLVANNQINQNANNAHWITSLAFHPDGTSLLVGNYAGTIRPYSIEGRQFLDNAYSKHSAVIKCLAMGEDGRYFISGDEKGIIRLWNEAFSFSHEAGICDIKILHSQKVIVASDSTGTVKIWDMDKGDLFSQLQEPGKTMICSLAISRDEIVFGGGSNFVNGEVDQSSGKLIIWDLKTGNEISAIDAHMGVVTHLAFTPDDSYLVTASDDKSIKVWEINF